MPSSSSGKSLSLTFSGDKECVLQLPAKQTDSSSRADPLSVVSPSSQVSYYCIENRMLTLFVIQHFQLMN